MRRPPRSTLFPYPPLFRSACSEDLVGFACQSAFCGVVGAAVASGGGGSGTSNTRESRFAFNSNRAATGVVAGVAPMDCCSSAGFGAIAAAVSVFTMRAQRYAPITAARAVRTPGYRWCQSLLRPPDEQGPCHQGVPLSRAQKRGCGPADDKLAVPRPSVLTN